MGTRKLCRIECDWHQLNLWKLLFYDLYFYVLVVTRNVHCTRGEIIMLVLLCVWECIISGQILLLQNRKKETLYGNYECSFIVRSVACVRASSFCAWIRHHCYRIATQTHIYYKFTYRQTGRQTDRPIEHNKASVYVCVNCVYAVVVKWSLANIDGTTHATLSERCLICLACRFFFFQFSLRSSFSEYEYEYIYIYATANWIDKIIL